MHTHCPASVFCLPSSSLQGREQAHNGCRQSGLYANEGFCARQPHGHCALCSGLLCWDRVGCRSTWRCRATMLSLKLPQLLRVHQVPRVFWEDGIMSGYRRPTSSALDCVLSSFQMTNETVNIWTHFLPTWFPELESPALSKILRTAAFTYPFLFDNLPLFYRLGLCWGRGHSCGQEALSTSHGYHLFCALLTGFLFASHLPERLAPGRFDYIGHSHQLFHICAVLGTHFQLEAVLADMGSRRAWLAMQEPPLGLAGTVATLGLAVAGNLLIIAAFTASLFRAPSTCPLLQGGPLERNTKAKLQ
ncbi:membrane progestin receptor delta isoform X3 [Phocoena sinus]|uniref:membrane progestin receptor delta isoform X3 n=2 Tax=Odontoceti TaxID=9722 RepID=UPI0013C4C9E5|nr:membrane progestin receptor delta isoform X3 [Phocoena sinus]